MSCLLSRVMKSKTTCWTWHHPTATSCHGFYPKTTASWSTSLRSRFTLWPMTLRVWIGSVGVTFSAQKYRIPEMSVISSQICTLIPFTWLRLGPTIPWASHLHPDWWSRLLGVSTCLLEMHLFLRHGFSLERTWFDADFLRFCIALFANTSFFRVIHTFCMTIKNAFFQTNYFNWWRFIYDRTF